MDNYIPVHNTINDYGMTAGVLNELTDKSKQQDDDGVKGQEQNESSVVAAFYGKYYGS